MHVAANFRGGDVAVVGAPATPAGVKCEWNTCRPGSPVQSPVVLVQTNGTKSAVVLLTSFCAAVTRA